MHKIAREECCCLLNEKRHFLKHLLFFHFQHKFPQKFGDPPLKKINLTGYPQFMVNAMLEIEDKRHHLQKH